MYKNWKIKKSDIAENQKQYTEVADWCDASQQYTIIEEEDEYKVVPIPEPSAEEQAEIEIARLKQYLADTDYVANKLIESVDDTELQDLKEKYAEVLKQRRRARARISELEG